MGLEHLWAGWRSEYVSSIAGGDSGADSDAASMFERILDSDLPDEETYVLARGEGCTALLNVYPYTNGHLMVLPNRAVGELEDLTDDEMQAVWSMVRDGVIALKRAYRCDGVNVGLNLGYAGGAGVPGHLHVHVLPRWAGDTNFMTSVAETRVLPESLRSTWERLREHWPS